MNKWTYALFLPFLLVISNLTHANEWYKVEVIIFANNGSSNLSAEQWPAINEVPAKSAISLKPASEGELDAYQALPGSLLSLHQEKAQLRASGKYRILYHTGWMQPVAETLRPKPVRIYGGNILDNGSCELEGYIGIGRGRYLHFRPDLYFNRSLSPTESGQSRLAASGSGAVNTARLYIPEVLTVNLNQARRMRSKDLHFIDHPLFGVLVEMKPVE
jgi:hypothetical protein